MSILLALSSAPAGIVISGALVAQAATVAGTVVDGSTLTGALSAQASAASGAVVVSDAGITASGSLVAQASSASGTVVGGSTISGALSAQSSTASGAVVGGSTLSGALAAQAAQVSGAVTASWLLHSPDVFLLENGVDKYQLEDLSGFYQREEIALEAESSSVSGDIFVEPIPSGGGFEPRKRRRDTAENAQERAERVMRERIALGIIEAPVSATDSAAPDLEMPRPAPVGAYEFEGDDEAEAPPVQARAPRPAEDTAGQPLTPAQIEELRALLARAAEEEDIAVLLLALAADR